MTFLKEFATLPVILLGITSLLLLFYPNWRWTLAAIGVQYLAVAWLVGLSWPIALAAVKLVVGWMAGALLATSSAAAQPKIEPLSGRLFRLAVAGLILIIILTLPPATRQWLQVDPSILLGTLILIGMGLVQTSMSNDSLRMTIGLLTFLAGFEILYAALESSVLVAGLLAVINLGLALAGSYLLNAPDSKEAG
jgi:hypothetical protein